VGGLFGQILKCAVLGGGALLAASSGCRQHEAFCKGSACEPAGEPRTEGGAPASGRTPVAHAGRSGGNGGEPGAAECHRNTDCDDRQSCNGPELCVDAACQSTAAPICLAGTECVETAAGHDCRYRTPSPWLIFEGRAAVYGLPLAEIDKRDPFLLGEQNVAEGVTAGFADSFFSPDGRRLWASFYSEDVWESTLFQVSLGPGLPGRLEPVRDLPNRGSFFDPVFAADGRHGFVEDEYSGLYLFDFTNEDASRYRGKLLGQLAHAWYARPAFCSDSRLLVVSGEVPSSEDRNAPSTAAWLFELGDDGELSKSELGPGAAMVSPDGRLIVLQGPDRVEVLGCQKELPRAELSDRYWESVSFAGKGRYVRLSEQDQHAIYSVANPFEPVLVFNCTECFVSWDDAEQHIFAHLPEDSQWLEMRGEETPVPGVPERIALLGEELAGRVEATGKEAFLVKGPEYDLEASTSMGGAGGRPEVTTTSEFGLIFRAAPTSIEPIVRAGHHEEGWLEWSDVDAGLAIVRRNSGDAELWLLRFAQRPFTEELIVAGPGTSELAVSPELSGFAYSIVEPLQPKRNKTVWQPFAQGKTPVELNVPGRPRFGPPPL
jgi:hypothetical protein